MNDRSRAEAAATVALLRRPGGHPRHMAELLERRGSALALIRDEEGGIFGPPRLFNDEDSDMQLLLDNAIGDLARWEAAGIRMLSVLDEAYPDNLRAVFDRPPVIFVSGALEANDHRAVAVIGSRRASPAGLGAAGAIAEHLVATGFTVISGLAAGIDTAAHTAALDRHGRTVAVIGTGLGRCYPPENRALQARIGREGAVVSQFWPEAGPSKRSFPARNAVMSGLARATVVVEASATSGARGQARLSLAHGRPVFLREPLLEQEWARQLACRPGVHVFASPGQVTSALARLDSGAVVA